MAHLDIQEKRSSAWIWWVLGLVLLALIAWWLLSSNGRDNVADTGVVPPPVVAGDPAAAAPAPAGAETITDLGALTSADDPNALMGRRVVLTGVPVAEAVSDKGFWIGGSKAVGDGVFAVRTNQSQPNTAPDGAVTAGRSANVYGVIQAIPTNLTEQTATWNLRATDSEALSQHRFYIHVDSVRLAGK